jgi:hypothetical protein
MESLDLSNINSAKSVLKKALSYFKGNFSVFTRFNLLVYLPLLTITGLQSIIYLLKSKANISSILLDLLGIVLGLFTTAIILATEPIIYAVLVIIALQLLNGESIDLQVVKGKLQKQLGNFIKVAVVFFVYFITIQQLTQGVLLFLVSFSEVKQYIDLETFFFSPDIAEKLDSIQLDKIILSTYPIKYFVTEFIGIVAAAFAVRKYYLYVPIVFMEDVKDLIPLKNSKLLINEIKNIATIVVPLAVVLPYLVNVTTTISLTYFFGLKGTASNMISNIAGAKEISLFISALINTLIYPTFAISLVLMYLRARQIMEKPE